MHHGGDDQGDGRADGGDGSARYSFILRFKSELRLFNTFTKL